MKYTMSLVIPTYVWANYEVEAASVEEAILKMYVANKASEIDFEHADFDYGDVEIQEVEDETGAVVYPEQEVSADAGR